LNAYFIHDPFVGEIHTPLTLACAKIDIDPEIIKFLLAHPDIDVNMPGGPVVGHTKSCPLSVAIIQGDTNTALTLANDNRVDVNNLGDGVTPLMRSISYRLSDVFEALLNRHDLDINLKNLYGNCAIRTAIPYEKMDFCSKDAVYLKHLLLAGADFDAVCKDDFYRDHFEQRTGPEFKILAGLPMQIRKAFGAELKNKCDSDIVAESLILENLLQRLNSKVINQIALWDLKELKLIASGKKFFDDLQQIFKHGSAENAFFDSEDIIRTMGKYMAKEDLIKIHCIAKSYDAKPDKNLSDTTAQCVQNQQLKL
jgi:hypothetical protein